MSFGADNYLDDIKCRKIRSSMTSLRVSAQKLEVESGQYRKPSVPCNMRYCSLCLSKGKYVVGDEYHTVIECEHFNAPREAMYSKGLEFCNNFNSMSGYQKFIYIYPYTRRPSINTCWPIYSKCSECKTGQTKLYYHRISCHNNIKIKEWRNMEP